MDAAIVMAPALDPETIDSMVEAQRRLVLGELASKLGNEGVMTTLKEMSRTKTVILKNVLK